MLTNALLRCVRRTALYRCSILLRSTVCRYGFDKSDVPRVEGPGGLDAVTMDLSAGDGMEVDVILAQPAAELKGT